MSIKSRAFLVIFTDSILLQTLRIFHTKNSVAPLLHFGAYPNHAYSLLQANEAQLLGRLRPAPVRGSQSTIAHNVKFNSNPGNCADNARFSC